MTISIDRLQQLRQQGTTFLLPDEFQQLLTLAERTIALRAKAVQCVQKHRLKARQPKPAEPAKRPPAGKETVSRAITDPDLLRHLQPQLKTK